MLLADQFDDGFEVFLIGRVEIIQLVAIHIEYQLRFALYDQRHDDFRFRKAAAGDMTRKFIDIGHELVFAFTRGRATNTFRERNVNAGEWALRRAERQPVRRRRAIEAHPVKSESLFQHRSYIGQISNEDRPRPRSRPRSAAAARRNSRLSSCGWEA